MAKADLKRAAGVGTSDFAAKLDLASLKAEENKIYIGKWKSASSFLSELSNIIYDDDDIKTKSVSHWLLRLMRLKVVDLF